LRIRRCRTWSRALPRLLDDGVQFASAEGDGGYEDAFASGERYRGRAAVPIV
jgi:hypothetical protein